MIINNQIKKQGYYYRMTVTWKNKPTKKYVHEYGNEKSAIEAVSHWNKYPEASASYERIEL